MNNASAARFNGTLKKWNPDRGFGFLVAEQGGQELFVHVSAFARDGRVPTVGETLTFEVERDKDGRKRAVRVRRPGEGAATKAALGAGHGHGPSHRRSSPPLRSETSSPWLGALLGVLLLAALGWYAYGQYSARTETVQQRLVSPLPTEEARQAPATVPEAAFACDGRQHCSQMRSCEEAKFFLRNCPDPKMDGDGDGVPCEQQLCTGLFGGSGAL